MMAFVYPMEVGEVEFPLDLTLTIPSTSALICILLQTHTYTQIHEIASKQFRMGEGEAQWSLFLSEADSLWICGGKS